MTPSDSAEPLRLSKLMAQRGLCSRREADRFIERGWVRVDGAVAVLGTKAAPDAEVSLDPRAGAEMASLATILLHKPIGYVSGQPEDGYKPAVALITEATQFEPDRAVRPFHHSIFKGLAPAGRLDIDSTGLLVLTQDGRIAKQLVGENSDVDKEYLVRVDRAASAEALGKLRYGLRLDNRPLKRAQIKQREPGLLQFILREGRKRQIRRMCDLVGLKVVSLKRVRIGRVRLGNLPKGEWRHLGEDEGF